MKWLNPFSKVESHSQQLSKIGCFTFVGTLSILYGASHLVGDLSRGLASIPLPSFPGFPKSISILALLAVSVALIFRVFRFHALAVSALRIRERYEIENILSPMAEAVNVPASDDLRKQLKRHRNELMSELFWIYAGYNNPKIDKHLVESALDVWCWVYVCLQLTVVSIVLAVFLLLVGHITEGGLAGSLAVVLALLGRLLIEQCKGISHREVAEILRDSSRRKKIQRRMNQL